MVFAIIVLIYFLFIQYLAHNVSYRENKFLPFYGLLFSFILLNLLRIYCQEIFPDIPNYRIIFEDTPSISFALSSGFSLDYFDPYVEIGFSLLISVFKVFSNSYFLFLFFVSTIELAVFYIFCNKFKISLINAIPIYLSFTYLTFQIGMLRQALAFCCFLIALIYINRKAIYFLLIFIGLTLHTSIIFCLFLFWSDRIINRNIFYALFMVALILYILEIDIIGTYLPYLQIEGSIAAGRVGYYMDVDRPNSYLGIGFWDRLILFVLMNIVYTKLSIRNEINKFNIIIYNLGISVILVQMIFFSSPTITSRLRYYIVIFPVIFLSEYIYSKRREGINWLYQIPFVMYLFMYLIFQATYLL
jgi:hypothetical protein